MRLEARIRLASIDEIVNVDVRSIRVDLFLMTCKESSGNDVVQLQDHQNGVVHNRARRADGNLFEVDETIHPA